MKRAPTVRNRGCGTSNSFQRSSLLGCSVTDSSDHTPTTTWFATGFEHVGWTSFIPELRVHNSWQYWYLLVFHPAPTMCLQFRPIVSLSPPFLAPWDVDSAHSLCHPGPGDYSSALAYSTPWPEPCVGGPPAREARRLLRLSHRR